MDRSRRITARVLLVLASLGLSLGAAEAAYRWTRGSDGAPDGGDDEWYQRYRHMNETIYRASSEPALIYEPSPGASVEMEYGPARFDRAGMRNDGETPPLPAPDRVRVAVLGDSLAWGEYLAVHDAIPNRTEDALGEGFEVLNAGVTGYDTAQEAIWYERAVRPLRARVVVMLFCMNDLMIMSGPYGRFASPDALALKDAQDAMFAERAPVRRETIDDVTDRREREASFRLLARALGLWDRWRLETAYVDEYLILAEDPSRIARMREAVVRFGDAVRADGAAPIVVISPVLERWDDYRWDALHAAVREAGEAANVAVIDPLDAFRSVHTADELRMGSDNLHYGRTGSRVMGEVIADAVRWELE